MNLRLSTDVGLKMLRLTDSASSLKLRGNETSSTSEIEMVVENVTSSDINTAPLVVNETTCSSSMTPGMMVNYTLSTNNVTMRKDSFNTNTPPPVDVDARIMSSTKTPETNYTSSFSNAAMGNDVIIGSNMSEPVVNYDRNSSSETLDINRTNSSQHVTGKRSVKCSKILHLVLPRS